MRHKTLALCLFVCVANVLLWTWSRCPRPVKQRRVPPPARADADAAANAASRVDTSAYWHTTAAPPPEKQRRVWLGFPFLQELDVLSMKLETLSGLVDRFVLIEATNSLRMQPKPLFFNESRGEPRFAAYRGVIEHIIEDSTPVGDNGGWAMETHMKQGLGRYYLARGGVENDDDDVVITSDSDEIPSADAVRFLAEHGVPPGVTYTLADTMPTTMYGFVWLAHARGYSTATARNMRDERAFWAGKIHGAPFTQDVRALPVDPSGWHCTYCLRSASCVLKLRFAHLHDGPPYLGAYDWNASTFDSLRGCGVSPQGSPLQRQEPPSALTAFERRYPHLFVAPPCTPFTLPYR